MIPIPFIRFVSLLLIPCLLADPAAASFSAAAWHPVSPNSPHTASFTRNAVIARISSAVFNGRNDHAKVHTEMHGLAVPLLRELAGGHTPGVQLTYAQHFGSLLMNLLHLRTGLQDKQVEGWQGFSLEIAKYATKTRIDELIQNRESEHEFLTELYALVIDELIRIKGTGGLPPPSEIESVVIEILGSRPLQEFLEKAKAFFVFHRHPVVLAAWVADFVYRDGPWKGPTGMEDVWVKPTEDNIRDLENLFDRIIYGYPGPRNDLGFVGAIVHRALEAGRIETDRRTEPGSLWMTGMLTAHLTHTLFNIQATQFKPGHVVGMIREPRSDRFKPLAPGSFIESLPGDTVAEKRAIPLSTLQSVLNLSNGFLALLKLHQVVTVGDLIDRIQANTLPFGGEGLQDIHVEEIAASLQWYDLLRLSLSADPLDAIQVRDPRLGLSTRASLAMSRFNPHSPWSQKPIFTARQLDQTSDPDLLDRKDLGRKTLQEIRKKITALKEKLAADTAANVEPSITIEPLGLDSQPANSIENRIFEIWYSGAAQAAPDLRDREAELRQDSRVVYIRRIGSEDFPAYQATKEIDMTSLSRSEFDSLMKTDPLEQILNHLKALVEYDGTSSDGIYAADSLLTNGIENVFQHVISNGHEALVIASREESELRIDVLDFGSGMSLPAVLREGRRADTGSQGNGLKSLIQEARVAQAKLNFRTALLSQGTRYISWAHRVEKFPTPASGTLLTLRIPLLKAQETLPATGAGGLKFFGADKTPEELLVMHLAPFADKPLPKELRDYVAVTSDENKFIQGKLSNDGRFWLYIAPPKFKEKRPALDARPEDPIIELLKQNGIGGEIETSHRLKFILTHGRYEVAEDHREGWRVHRGAPVLRMLNQMVSANPHARVGLPKEVFVQAVEQMQTTYATELAQTGIKEKYFFHSAFIVDPESDRVVIVLHAHTIWRQSNDIGLSAAARLRDLEIILHELGHMARERSVRTSELANTLHTVVDVMREWAHSSGLIGARSISDSVVQEVLSALNPRGTRIELNALESKINHHQITHMGQIQKIVQDLLDSGELHDPVLQPMARILRKETGMASAAAHLAVEKLFGEATVRWAHFANSVSERNLFNRPPSSRARLTAA